MFGLSEELIDQLIEAGVLAEGQRDPSDIHARTVSVGPNAEAVFTMLSAMGAQQYEEMRAQFPKGKSIASWEN